ncbi:unnamed protein product [Cladocopium goreaui]|uniref:C17orf113 probable zinc finger domain-containing protein n=1 Tax=Cladocopium goreaui TaxID=2562237 RepID=A0A9P1DHB0_9DINO|nr:unnamed protein product [Cladocopium goreaui]
MGDSRDKLKHLVPGKLVTEHTQTCKRGVHKCSLCAVQQSWSLYKKPWLRVLLVDGESKLGCSLCAKAGLEGPWANFEQTPTSVLKKHNLERHEKSKGHMTASQDDLCGAPSDEAFKSSLQGMTQGQSARQGGGSSDKKTQVRYALSEAVCARNRTLLAESRCISLMRDERKGNLLVRFRAVLPDLTTISGALGLQPVTGSAESIAEATAEIMQNFCQPMRQPPRQAKESEQPVDSELLRKIQDRVTMVASDAAASELLAGDLERGRRRAATDFQSKFTNCKIVGRDAAHASTRLLKRPFLALEPVKSLTNEWIHGSESFAQKVHHSHILSQWWAKAVQCKEDSDLTGNLCTSMSAAKHRFSSYLNPLSRIIRNLQAAFNVCGRVQAMRGAEATWATKLCQNFSSFKAALLAMITDAAAISNDYTRECDREDIDEWVSLVEEVVAHEFPSWHLAAAFQVFHLSDCVRGRDCSADVLRNLERLAQVYSVPFEALKQEYARLLPIAAALKKQAGLSNREAWREALQRTSSRKGAQGRKYEATALIQVMAAYQCWTAATSGVEQQFSKLKRSPVELSNASVDTDRRLAIVMGDGQARSPAVQPEVIQAARRIYASLLSSGRSRPRTKPRFDCGVTGKVKTGSFANWNRTRKKALLEAVQKCETPPRKPSELLTAEALADGCLLPDEVTQEVQEEALRLTKANRQGLSGPAWCCSKMEGGKAQAVSQSLTAHGVATRTQDLRQAKLFVVSNFVRVQRKVRFMAALSGSVLMSASALLGAGGVKLTFHPGQEIQVAIFVTDTFKAEEPGMTLLLREACARGWQAVRAEDLKGRGRKPSLHLRGAGEAIPAGFNKTRVKCFTVTEFLRWLTATCLNKTASSRVKIAAA